MARAFRAARPAFLACLLLTRAFALQGNVANPLEVAFQPARQAELAGERLMHYPHFEYVRAFHEGGAVHVAVDPARYPSIVGAAADLWIVANRDRRGWHANPALVDVRGAPQSILFSGHDLESNTFRVTEGHTLSGEVATGLGVGYDVVIDMDRDGRLGRYDFIDGWSGIGGFYVVRDPSAPGPLAVTEIQYSGGAFLGQNTFFPSFLDKLDRLPLVIVSHGNGHDFRWYDHIGRHLASYGFIVVSHETNTQPGSETASTSTLRNIDYLLEHQDVISDGALNGHIDATSIVLIGHSRGGEGAVRAYNRLLTGQYFSPNFDAGDIRLVSALAPVTHLDPVSADPAGVAFQLIYGAADADVSGLPGCCNSKPFALFERSEGDRLALYIQGAGHADLHNGGGYCWCTGPALIGTEATHRVLLGYLLPSIASLVRRNEPGKDYWTRLYDDFRPPGIPAGVVVAKDFRAARGRPVFVLDDFETNAGTAVSSSGGVVETNLANLSEGFLEDTDGSFAYNVSVPMNGMTRFADFGDAFRGVVFEWGPGTTGFYEQEVIPAERDLSDDAVLSFRACQGTRHPSTDALDAPLSFTISLRHANGRTSSVRLDNYGAVTRTYERTGAGPGSGWANEFVSVRLRLSDFLTDRALPDLADIEAVRFDFGGPFGSPRGRLAMDDIEVQRESL